MPADIVPEASALSLLERVKADEHAHTHHHSHHSHGAAAEGRKSGKTEVGESSSACCVVLCFCVGFCVCCAVFVLCVVLPGVGGPLALVLPLRELPAPFCFTKQ